MADDAANQPEEEKVIDMDASFGVASAEDYVSLPSDFYSVNLVCFLIDFGAIHNGRGKVGVRLFRILLVILLQAISLLAQILLVIKCRTIISEIELHNMLYTLADFYDKVDHDSPDADARWDAWGDNQRGICKWGMAQFLIFFLVIWQWGMCALGEMRPHAGVFFTLCRLPPSFEDGMLVTSIIENDQIIITGARLWQKLLALIIIYFPKFMISINLLMTGSEFLHYSQSFGALVLNQFAMEVVMGIDDLLYATTVTDFQKRRVECTKIAISDYNSGTETSNTQHKGEQCKSLALQFVMIIVTLVWPFLYIFVLERNFYDFPYFWIDGKCSEAIDKWIYEPTPMWG